MKGLGALFWLFLFAMAPVLWKYHLKKLAEHYQRKISKSRPSDEPPEQAHTSAESRSPKVGGADQLIALAQTGLTAEGHGELVELDVDVVEHLAGMYGHPWVAHNEALLRAMLTFVDDFRLFASPEGRKLWAFYEGDPTISCLVNVHACIEQLRIKELPTLTLGEPNLAAFTASFGLFYPGALSAVAPADELERYSVAGTAVILMLAVSVGTEFNKRVA